MNRLGNDDFIRPDVTTQDYISTNKILLKEKIKDFIQVESKFIEQIPCNTWIKYINNEGLYRAGGILIKNAYPEYLVLKNPYIKKSWCVNLKTNYIFMENIKAKKEEEIEKNNLYKLYQNGFIKILENPE